MIIEARDLKKYYVVGASIFASIAVVFGLTFAFVEWVVIRGNEQWKYPSIPLPDPYANVVPWKTTGTIPTDALSDEQFGVFVTFVLWVTIEITGLGIEAFVWTSVLLPGGLPWSSQRETQWKIAQFLFPILVVTSIGMAFKGEFFCLPVLVAGMWKCGFPETILYYYLSLYDPKSSKLQRLVDWLNGVGLAVHHGAAAFLISTLLAGIVPPSRYILDGCLILVMQHWFVLLAYVNTWLYCAIELTLEAWFQCSLFSNFQYFYGLHWTGGLGAAVFLVAHWLFLIAALLDLFTPTDESEAPPENVFVRGILTGRRLEREAGPLPIELQTKKRTRQEEEVSMTEFLQVTEFLNEAEV